MEVISFIGHAGRAGVGGGEVNIIFQLNQSDVMLHGIGRVELGVHNNFLDFNVCGRKNSSWSRIIVISVYRCI